jgi:hypothetical protein
VKEGVCLLACIRSRETAIARDYALLSQRERVNAKEVERLQQQVCELQEELKREKAAMAREKEARSTEGIELNQEKAMTSYDVQDKRKGEVGSLKATNTVSYASSTV